MTRCDFKSMGECPCEPRSYRRSQMVDRRCSMTNSRLLEKLQSKLSEAEDNIIRLETQLQHQRRSKAYWERAIAAAKGENDFRGEVPVLKSASTDAIVRGAVMS